MGWLFFMVLVPELVGIAIAGVWWFRRRRKASPGGSVSAVALAAGLILIVGVMVVRLIAGPLPLVVDVPGEFWDWYRDYRFTVPLLFGIFGLVLLAFPVRSRRGSGAAELSPRTPLSFAQRWWVVGSAVVLAIVLAVTVITGAMSQPDPTTGQFSMYFVDLGGERGMGTGIYGWHYSVPCLILIGIMILIAAIDLFLIARPALNLDHDLDARNRGIRTRNVLAVVTGALLMHLGLIFGSLAGTASIRSSFPTSAGNVSFWTTFAALEPVFVGASSLAAALAFALWATVALSAIPSRERVPDRVRS